MTGLEDFSIEGKVAVVTGAGRGIGKAIALTMAQAGADVTVVARTKEQIEETAEDIRKLGRRALVIPTDVTQEAQVKRAVEQTISEFGHVDILVNNAGNAVLNPVAALPEKPSRWEGGDNWDKPLTKEDWYRIMDTNLTSVFFFAQAVGPYMMKQRKGKVINISSTNADEGVPFMSVYCVSKAGLASFTRCLASEWAPFNINVNAVAPGIVSTPLSEPLLSDPEIKKAFLEVIPLGRIGEPREIALAALFLASDASNYLAGQTITVDGGAMGRGPGI